MPPRYLNRPEALEGDADVSVELPYGMTAAGVVAAINDAYAYLHALNRASIEHGYNRLEDLMQPAGFNALGRQKLERGLARVKRNVQRSIHRQERVTTSLHPPGAEGSPPIPRGGGAASWYCSPYRRGRRCCGCSGRRGSAAPHGPW